MKTWLILAPLAFLYYGFAQENTPSGISDKNKADYIETLNQLKENSKSRQKQLAQAGTAALAPAAHNPNEAMKLFEKCYKKVHFDDNPGASDKEWREWRTNNKDAIANDANKRAITYQIRWALLCMKAAAEPEETLNPDDYVQEVGNLFKDVLLDSKVIAESTAPFNDSIISGPIGEVYNLTDMKPESWPDNVMHFPMIIDALVLKKAREEGNIDALRKGWNTTIAITRKSIEAMQEAAKKEARAVANESGGPERRFITEMINRLASEDIDETINMLEWAREADCFAAGDELRASANMMKLIAKTKNFDRQQMLIRAMESMLNRPKDGDDANTNRSSRRMGPGAGGGPGRGPGQGGPPGAP